MPLKSLTINGFKSFPDKVTLEFPKGITGIVGPNGSGKSNITEAMRWVMGETNVRHLRGENTTDVIFGGTAMKAPLNRAEVTVSFDNQAKQLNSDFKEIEITRTIFRNGDTNYQINQQNVRLKDIHDLFMDSGLSKESFSIISQGSVEQIFNAKPADRRSVIEEAAGVLKFKQQKKTAELKLKQTQDNLVRINDFVKELETRIEPLKQQKSLAEEYHTQKNGYDSKNKIVLTLETNDRVNKQEQTRNQNNQTKQKLQKLDRVVASTQQQLEEYRKERHSLRDRQDQLQADYNKLVNQNYEIKTQLAVYDQSTEFDETNRKELKTRQDELQSRQQQLEKELGEKEKQLNTVTQQYNQLKDQERELKTKVSQDPGKLQKDLESLRDDYIDNLQNKTTLSNQIIFAETAINQLKGELTSPEVKELESNSVSLDAQIEKVTQEKQTQKNWLDKLETEVADSLTAIEKSTATVVKKQKERSELKELAQGTKAQLQALKRLHDNHEGYFQGVKSVLNHKSEFPGILGVVSELIDFDSRHQLALDTALASNAQNLVSKTQDNAKNAIKTLREKNLGRATFLPLDQLRQQVLSTEVKKILKTTSGYLGTASDLVSCSDEVKPAVIHLLGRIIVMDNLDHATQLSRLLEQRHHIVTLDGDYLSPGGQMSGGSHNKNSQSPLLIKKQLEDLTAKSQAFDSQIAEVQSHLQQEITEKQRLEKIQAENTNKVAEVKSELMDFDNQINRIQDEKQSLTKQLNYLRHGLQAKKSELEKQQAQYDQLNTQKVKAEQDVEKVQRKIKETQAQIQNFDQISQHVQAQLNELLPEIAVFKTKQENYQSQITEKQADIKQSQQQQAQLQEKLIHLSQAKEKNSQDLDKQKKKFEQNQVTITTLNQQIKETAQKLSVVENKVATLETDYTKHYDSRKIVAEAQEKESNQLAILKSEINTRLETLNQDYHLTFEKAMSDIGNPEEVNINQLQHEIKLHKLSLEDIGPVNLGAIEEYKEVKERYDFLHQQQEDLLSAKSTLENTMNEMDKEVSTRFKETFEQVSAAFADIFPKMFGGGHAKLALTDETDILNTGIDIIAQPPGKKLQSLSLLSGGERALTTITLLFAILKVRPVPFCILDEVEASLDEANVDRFAQFLKNYDLTTQFIMITHRKGSMAQADQLYGVMMQESGISSLLSVSLSEIEQQL
ncbi:chromosome segregation protein SMC [Holzapfeliella floricola]|uniref:Chromosome partition protein Smc n=1 Tax=Holzapfeliella floricola DSM 23037 = JCM 16512 TaxID=1423744 RepID=A0A0R2DIA7_9LACO|nr:chromosome segregation protein SMC [Holzapfeliella floricola]KRN03824.1 cell division protein Smc [Holzapfeliella floricola DSM 23037 = JCM 16512]